MKQPKFKPRNLNDEMPLVIRDLTVIGGETGVHLNNTNALINGYRSIGTKRPIQLEGTSRVILRNPDFRY
jgi:hypothetical protein